MRADRSTSRVGRIWLDLEPRRETLFLINIGVPILIGVARGEGRGALIGGITGLLLSLADLEGPLARRLRLSLMVAAGLAVGGLLGIWLKSFEAIFLDRLHPCRVRRRVFEPGRQGPAFLLAVRRHLFCGRCGASGN
jgi:hypothetical protein